MKNRQRNSVALRARGFTLVESLVAVLVLSIGLLGIAALQVSSLRTNHVAYQRTQATFMAYDLLDRMRANRVAATAGSYNRNYGDGINPIALGVPLSDMDMGTWLTRLALVLPPGADASRQPDARVQQIGNEFVISLRWDDSKGQDALVEFLVRSRI